MHKTVARDVKTKKSGFRCFSSSNPYLYLDK